MQRYKKERRKEKKGNKNKNNKQRKKGRRERKRQKHRKDIAAKKFFFCLKSFKSFNSDVRENFITRPRKLSQHEIYIFFDLNWNENKKQKEVCI